MQRRLLAVFALVLLALVGFVVWRALHGSDPHSIGAERADGAPARVEAPPAARGELAAPRSAEPAPMPAPEPESAPLADQRELAAQGAVEFTLEVTWPADVPADERAFLVVQGRKTSDVISRVPLQAGGKRTLYLPKAHDKGRVALEARYLYLDEPVKLDPAKRAKPLACEPKLGAWLHGRVVLPAAESEHDLTRARVTRQSMRVTRSGNQTTSTSADSDSAPIDAEGRYSLGGLQPTMSHWISLDLPAFVKHQEQIETVEAGQAIERDIPLGLGASFLGRVVDERGEPVAKARVTCVVDDLGWSHQVDRVVESGADGSFALRGVEPKRMKLYVTRQGFLDHAGEKREHAAGEVQRDLVITLRRGNALAGTVRWSDGRPADGAAIFVADLGGSDRPNLWGGPADGAPDAKCDGQGAFEVTGLGDGPFEVRASATEVVQAEGRRKQRKPWRATLDSVEPNRRDLALVLEPPRALVGTVKDDLGQPVAKFTVTARPIGPDGDARWEARVSQLVRDAGGGFRLEKVHPGSWDVEIEAPGHQRGASQRAVVEDGEVALEFVCPRAAELSGRVLDPQGEPQAGAQVQVEALGERDYRWGSGCSTESDGTFACANLPTGAVRVWASHPSWAQSEPQELELAPGSSLAGLSLHLELGGRLEVELITPAGVERAGREVALQSRDSHERYVGSRETDAAGRAVFEHVPTGKYRVNAWGRDETSGIHESGEVEVFEGRTAVLVLGRAGAAAIRVSGRVTSGGEPLEGVGVSFSPREGDGAAGNRWSRTDADGRYELVLDQPGRWQTSFNAAGSSVTAEIDVPAAPSFVHDVVFGSASIEGRVVDSDGKPVVGVGVTLQDLGADDASHRGAWAQTNARGEFEFGHVSPGTCRLVTYSGNKSGRGLAPARSEAFEVAEGQALRGIELVMAVGGKLEVRVRGPRGEADVWIAVDEVGGEHLASEGLDAAAERVELGGLPAVRVRVQAWGDGVRGAPVEVELAAGATRTVEVELVASATALVRLVDASGKAVEGHASLGTLEELLASESKREARAEHGFEDLLPGKYHVAAKTPDGASGELDFEIGAGERKTFELKISK